MASVRQFGEKYLGLLLSCCVSVCTSLLPFCPTLASSWIYQENLLPCSSPMRATLAACSIRSVKGSPKHALRPVVKECMHPKGVVTNMRAFTMALILWNIGGYRIPVWKPYLLQRNESASSSKGCLWGTKQSEALWDRTSPLHLHKSGWPAAVLS